MLDCFNLQMEIGDIVLQELKMEKERTRPIIEMRMAILLRRKVLLVLQENKNLGSITKLMGFWIPHIINPAHINEF